MPANNIRSRRTAQQALTSSSSASSLTSLPSEDETYSIIVRVHDLPSLAMAEVFMLRLKSFKGTVCEDANDWWTLFENLKEFASLTDAQTVASAPHYFENLAEQWYKGLPDGTKSDYNLLKTAFKNYFCDKSDISKYFKV